MKAQVQYGGNTASDVILVAQDIVTAITGNTNYTTPSPSLATVSAAITAAQAALGASEAAFTVLRQKRVERNDAVDALKALLESLVGYVQSASGGDEAKILSAGMSVRQPPTPIGPLDAPAGISATANGSETSAHLACRAVRGASSYEFQQAINAAGPWVTVEVVPRANTDVEALTPGTRYYFRARGIGTAGPGPFSDIATKMAG
ncbi:MAG: fibronectin type III domain-containing protein [Verrucomicrobia bacterium]|nr:fibronectin type III domain-containing protein [Verrucomicrobiota bacterium]